MKKTIKENKVLFVLALIIIIALVLMAIGLISYFYGNNKSPYGDRLNNIENYPIKKTIDSDIKALYEDQVESVKVEIKGKIIYIIMDINKDVNKADAKDLTVKALEAFSEEELNYYDIQFLITKKNEEEETKSFPIEGYKNSSSNSIVWTNN